MLEDVASDKRLDVGSVISSTVPFKIVLQSACRRFWFRISSGLFGKSGSSKTTTLLSFLAHLGQAEAARKTRN